MSARVGLADLAFSPKDEVALVGSSGCGKSTLIKVVAGLYKPSRGGMLIDGQPLDRWSAQSLRSQIALVAQDDSLLQGDDMERMPMGYECLVVDMSTLKLC